jgi:predicted transcriptional regulator
MTPPSKLTEVEDVLCSKTRMKIILLLLELCQLDTSSIADKLKINYSAACKNLEILENAGILVHRSFGRIRQYRIDEHSARASVVKALAEAWKTRT